MLLENYAAQRGFTNCVHYTDDGWSGGNFERRTLLAAAISQKPLVYDIKERHKFSRTAVRTVHAVADSDEPMDGPGAILSVQIGSG